MPAGGGLHAAANRNENRAGTGGPPRRSGREMSCHGRGCASAPSPSRRGPRSNLSPRGCAPPSPHGRRWDPRGVPNGWANGATGCWITRRTLALMQRESGKSWGDANMEVPFATEFINYWAENGPQFVAEETVRQGRCQRREEVDHRLRAVPARRCNYPVECSASRCRCWTFHRR